MKLRISPETVSASNKKHETKANVGNIHLIDHQILEEDESIIDPNGQHMLGSN